MQAVRLGREFAERGSAHRGSKLPALGLTPNSEDARCSTRCSQRPTCLVLGQVASAHQMHETAGQRVGCLRLRLVRL